MSIQCSACKKTSKEENYSVNSLSSGSPICSVCEIHSLMHRLELARTAITKAKEEQKVVIGVTSSIDKVVTNKPTKPTSKTLLRNILSAAKVS